MNNAMRYVINKTLISIGETLGIDGY